MSPKAFSYTGSAAFAPGRFYFFTPVSRRLSPRGATFGQPSRGTKVTFSG
jgi:hypothetical protein